MVHSNIMFLFYWESGNRLPLFVPVCTPLSFLFLLPLPAVPGWWPPGFFHNGRRTLPLPYPLFLAENLYICITAFAEP